MSNNHIPFISTTPPPLDDSNEDIINDEDDDVANFTGILSPEVDLDLNLEKFDAQIKLEDNNKSLPLDVEIVNSLSEDENEHTKNDKINYDSKNNCDIPNSSSTSLSQNDEDKLSCKSVELPQFVASEDQIEDSKDFPQNNSNKCEKIEIKNQVEEEENEENEENEEEGKENDDDFEDFAEFENYSSDKKLEQTNLNSESQDQWTSETETSSNQIKCENDFNSERQVDDDFADFSSFQDFSNDNLQNSNFSNFPPKKETDSKCDNLSSVVSHEENFDNENDVDDDFDDDFADFATASNNFKENPTMSNPTMSKDDFKENPTMSRDNFEKDEDQFADFESFDANVNLSKEKDDSHSSIRNEKIDSLIKETFFSDLVEKLDQENQTSINISRDLFFNAEINSKKLWEKVQNLEETPSLKLNWPNSHSFQLLLKSLKIDPKIILQNSVPIFASGLGLLEPTKGPLKIHNQELENQSENIQNEHQSSNGNNHLPHVQCDWTSSDLNNPLDVTQTLDLDFFVTNDDINTSEKDNEKNNKTDFEEFLTDSNHNSFKPNDNSNILKVLSNYNSPVKTASGKNQEIIQILDELPNLSFMRANILMFPIKSTDNEPQL